MSKGPCSGPMARRDLLKVGTLALGGLSLPELLAARSKSPSTRNHDNSVILFWCYGGMSQLETYDLKPDAPTEFRSVYKPISSSIPGMDLCELFPQQAKLADKISIIRSMHHRMNSHSDGHIHGLTGKPPIQPDPTSNQKSEHPDFGMIASKLLGRHPRALPRFVSIPSPVNYTRVNYLGVEHQSFPVGDPSANNYSPPHLTLQAGLRGDGLLERQQLLAQFDRLRSNLDLHGTMDGTDTFRQSAFDMLTHPAIAKAFDISKESDDLRNRYGRHRWGQSLLLARRLAEAGSNVISVAAGAAKNGWEYTNWDDHPGNNGREGHFARFLKTRLPYMDEAISALIEDIYTRGLDQKILVVVLSEFGRTPMIRVGPPNGSIGRDHWPQAYSAMVSGGGLQMGQVVGATNSKSEYPTKSPHTPGDLLATIYRHLGIDTLHEFDDFAGRPIPILPEGEPIGSLI